MVRHYRKKVVKRLLESVSYIGALIACLYSFPVAAFLFRATFYFYVRKNDNVTASKLFDTTRSWRFNKTVRSKLVNVACG